MGIRGGGGQPACIGGHGRKFGGQEEKRLKKTKKKVAMG